MSDFRTQIRTYVEDTIERIDSDDVAVVVSNQSAVSNQARWFARPTWVAVGAAALVLIAVGFPILFVGGDDPVVVDQVMTTMSSDITTAPVVTTTVGSEITTAPAVTTTVPTFPTRLKMTWQQAPTQPAFGEQAVIHSVVEGGPGLVAVGTAWTRPAGRDEGGWNEETAVWTSTDGMTWERVTGLDEQEIVLTDLANGPGGLVGVSFLDSIYGTYEETGPPIWISPDGTSWSRVTGNEEAFGDSVTISDIAAGGSGYVAVGTDGDVIEAAIWTSADGLTWTRVQQVLGDGYEESIVYEVASTSSGFVATGEGGDEGFEAYWEGDYQQGIPRPVSNLLVWTSQDGITWDRIDLSPEEPLPQGAATIDGATITFGYEGDLNQTLIDLEGDRLATMGYLVTGHAAGRRSFATAWASEDGGVTWFEVTRIGDPITGGGYSVDAWLGEPAGFRDVTLFGDGFVAVGGTGDGSAPVWIGAWNED